MHKVQDGRNKSLYSTMTNMTGAPDDDPRKSRLHAGMYGTYSAFRDVWWGCVVGVRCDTLHTRYTCSQLNRGSYFNEKKKILFTYFLFLDVLITTTSVMNRSNGTVPGISNRPKEEDGFATVTS